MPPIECCLAQDGSSASSVLNEDSVSHRRGQGLLRGDPCRKGRDPQERTREAWGRHCQERALYPEQEESSHRSQSVERLCDPAATFSSRCSKGRSTWRSCRRSPPTLEASRASSPG